MINLYEGSGSEDLLVVHLGEGPVAFLSSRIPHFELDNVLVQLDIFGHERPTNGWFVSLAKLARVVSNADAGLANSHVTKKHNFVSDCGLIGAALRTHRRSKRHVLKFSC